LSRSKAPNFGVLLVVLCLLIVLAPLATAAGSALLVEFLFALVLLAGAYSINWQGIQRWFFLAFTALTFVARSCALLFGGSQLEIGSAAITALWMASVVIVVVRELFRRQAVTTNTILSAIVAYLLIAVAFAALYQILELSEPGSFLGIPEAATAHQLSNEMIYFSLVSLTTMGYGDIVPASSLARPLAALEGVFGALYLAVMIARLVGMHVASGFDRDRP
jgi:fucose 4-O-acetylase-like acetyltransferase